MQQTLTRDLGSRTSAERCLRAYTENDSNLDAQSLADVCARVSGGCSPRWKIPKNAPPSLPLFERYLRCFPLNGGCVQKENAMLPRKWETQHRRGTEGTFRRIMKKEHKGTVCGRQGALHLVGGSDFQRRDETCHPTLCLWTAF